MRRRKITIDFHVKSSVNDAPVITGTVFARTLEKFARENLAGALSVTVNGENDGIVTVSPTHAAHTVKMLLSYAPANEPIRMAVVLTDKLTMKIPMVSGMGSEEISKIISFATSCGFAVERTNNSFLFTSDIKQTETMKVYAITSEDFTENLTNIFNL